MSRYIDIEEFSQMVYENFGRDGEFDYRDLIKILSEQPTADVKEVVHGEWNVEKKNVRLKNGMSVQWVSVYCTNCGKENNCKTDFCPNCGADMREIKNED